MWVGPEHQPVQCRTGDSCATGRGGTVGPVGKVSNPLQYSPPPKNERVVLYECMREMGQPNGKFLMLTGVQLSFTVSGSRNLKLQAQQAGSVVNKM